VQHQDASSLSQQKLNPSPVLSTLSNVGSGYSNLLGNSDLTPDALLNSNNVAATATISTPNNNSNNNDKHQNKQLHLEQQQHILYEDTKFQPTIDFVRSFLDNVVQQSSPFGDKEQNKLTYEVNLFFFLLTNNY